MQSMAAGFGASIVRAPTLVHGEASDVEHDGRGLLAGMPEPFPAARYHSLCVDIGGEGVLLAKPQTFMNESGRSVGAVLRYTYAKPADLIVLHDELDLPLGTVRVKAGGGHGGHNGLRSLIEHLGSADFVRVRIGVGRPAPELDAADYVLSPFSADEGKTAAEAVEKAAEAVRAVVLEGPVKAMNRFNKQ